MTKKQEYILGMAMSYLFGMIITPLFLIVIGSLRLFLCLWGLAVDAFLFTPRVAQSYHDNFWGKQPEKNQNNHHLNWSGIESEDLEIRLRGGIGRRWGLKIPCQ